MTARRRHTAAALLLLAILCAFFWPLLLGRELTHSHLLFSQVPWAGDRPAGLDTPLGNGAVESEPNLARILELTR